MEEHRAKGANLAVDVPWKYLNFFMEDDNKLARIGEEYGSGRMLTGARARVLPQAHLYRTYRVCVIRAVMQSSFALRCVLCVRLSSCPPCPVQARSRRS